MSRCRYKFNAKMKDSTNTEKKIQYGDFKTLAKLLKCSYEAAKKRYYRGNEEALTMMKKLTDAKENLITDENAPESDNQVKTCKHKKSDNMYYP